MSVAELVLRYLEVLAWPLVVAVALIAFRNPISDKIGQLKDVKTPIGETSFFEEAAREVEASAEAAAEDQATLPFSGPEVVDAAASSGPPHSEGSGEPPRSSERRNEERAAEGPQQRHDDSALLSQVSSLLESLITSGPEVRTAQTFETARKVALLDPNAGALAAFRALERSCREAADALAIPLPKRHTTLQIVEALTEHNLSDEFVDVVRDLTRLRNQLTHGEDEVSLSGSLSFISAAESAALAIRKVVSRARHPAHRWAARNSTFGDAIAG